MEQVWLGHNGVAVGKQGVKPCEISPSKPVHTLPEWWRSLGNETGCLYSPAIPRGTLLLLLQHSSHTQSTSCWACGLNPWPFPLANSCHICISSPLKDWGGWRSEPPPLPLLLQQASFSSQWPPAQAYQPGQQSGVNAPSTPIVSELMKCSLPVPSHSLARRQMTSGNILNGYRHRRGA